MAVNPADATVPRPARIASITAYLGALLIPATLAVRATYRRSVGSETEPGNSTVASHATDPRFAWPVPVGPP